MTEVGDIVEVQELTVLLGGERRWLRKAIPPVRAVGGVSFAVRAGEILGLVDESGCGKTTLGRTLLGLQRETSGEIRLHGSVESDVPSIMSIRTPLPRSIRGASAIHLGRLVEMAPAAELFPNPRHPYTRALLEAVPRLEPDPRWRSAALQGEPPSAARLPPSCVFSTRCAHVVPAWCEAEPALQDDREHAVACRRWREIAPVAASQPVAVASADGSRASSGARQRAS